MSATDHHDRRADGPGDNVVPFPERPAANETPGRQPGTELVLDDSMYAEIVDEEPGQLVPAGATKPPSPVVRVLQPIIQPVIIVVRHDRTVRASKVVARNLVYVATGAGVLAKRVYDRRTKYDRYERAAEIAGDQERLRYWEERGEKAKENKHKRRIERAELWWRRTRRLVVYLPVTALFLLLIGFAVAAATGDWSWVPAPLVSTFKAAGWLVATGIAMAWLLLLALGTAGVAGLWLAGKRAEAVPQWLAPAADVVSGDVMDGLPDEAMIVQALRKTVPALDKALKEGWRMHYEMPPMLDGKGWRAQLALPPAAPVVEFVKRKPMLAHNLRRYPIEVWPTEPKPAVLDLWVAKPGALSGPVDPWPLLKNLDNARTDYFKGVPVSVTIKGDVIIGRLSEANWVAGGMMGSGKSTLVITALCGAMLDPVVDIDVVVMAENVDYDPMQPRLNRLVTGIDTAEQCMAMLYELYDEISHRGKALKDHDQRAVTREIAAKDPRLKPRILVIDECQNLFIGEHGKDAIEVTTKVMSTARKYGITLMFLTPEPSKDALPRKLISIASNKACYAIGDHQANDAVLGSGSYKSGISAVGLTPKTDEGPGDVGTCMQRGFTAKPGLMRGFYIAQPDVHRVTQRALQLRNGPHRRLLAAGGVEVRDLLADVDQVLDGRDASAADVARLLARAFPAHVPYRHMNGVDLAARLTAEGAKVPTTKNRHPVYGRVVKEALRARNQRSG